MEEFPRFEQLAEGQTYWYVGDGEDEPKQVIFKSQHSMGIFKDPHGMLCFKNVHPVTGFFLNPHEGTRFKNPLKSSQAVISKVFPKPESLVLLGFADQTSIFLKFDVFFAFLKTPAQSMGIEKETLVGGWTLKNSTF